MEGYLALIKEQREENDKLQEEIERLNKENKILRENAEHNDKVVDKVNWENKRLNNIINDKKERQDIAIRLLHKLFGTDDYEINYIIGIINGQRQIKFDEELKGSEKE